MLPLLLLLACGSDDASDSGSTSDGGATDGPPPLVEDDSYEVGLGRTWNLIGDGLTPGHDSLDVVVEGADAVRVWLNGEAAGSLSNGAGSVDIGTLPAGEHILLLSADDGQTAFAEVAFLRSAALYTIATVDWDRADTDDDELSWNESLHDSYPSFRLTQLVGPYTFTDPDVSTERRTELVAWLRNNEATWDDETGLHIHPYCSFIEAAGMTCVTETSYVYDAGDETGYTVPLWTYALEEQVQMLEAAIDIFEANGLDAPTSFRAGAWMADENLLQALSQTGFVAESSALNTDLLADDSWATFEEDYGEEYNNLLWDWNVEAWSEIGPTSQPYHPSATDAQAEGDLSILQAPDNGALLDYVSTEDMVGVLEANWDGDPLDGPVAFSIGYHNNTNGIGWSYRPDFEGILDVLGDHLAEHDDGPVVYITLSEAAAVAW